MSATNNVCGHYRADRVRGIEVEANPGSLMKFLNPEIPTKIFVHGYRNNISSKVPALMKNGKP